MQTGEGRLVEKKVAISKAVRKKRQKQHSLRKIPRIKI
jgi:hypothetical protein